MRWITRIALALLLVVGVALLSLALVVSHNGACVSAPGPSADAERMKAIEYRCYGTADVLKVETVVRPVPADNQVRVQVRAASINPLDWHYLHGTPYLMRLSAGIGTPKDPGLGADFAGVVESVGRSVTHFKAGDAVFGQADGTLAEFVTLPEDGSLASKPDNISFEQAAAIPVAGVTALQALRDQAHVLPGQKVLINGASGGVGTFAVQIAKALGAEVTGVCSTHNVEMVRSLGADHVVDYTKEDFTKSDQRYDVVLDNVVNHSLWDYRHVLTPKGILVIVGGGSSNENPWIGAFQAPLKASVQSLFVSPRWVMFFADVSAKNLTAMHDLVASGKVTPVIDRHYALDETATAMRYLEQGHARGKIVIDIP
ncbi:MAG TPA: NAD(P)-dependent alcohol dehydrogenase [Steroidobacteraceae bacterium]|jgi:NADPH:quinone reductase-like Zn-dependent oxidoreductase|nr:NAD(P)-dependent alcohol dehydrogenase [Steroidobacteraceae bacterium]